MPPVGFEPTISAGERPQTYQTAITILKPIFLVLERYHAIMFGLLTVSVISDSSVAGT